MWGCAQRPCGRIAECTFCTNCTDPYIPRDLGASRGRAVAGVAGVRLWLLRFLLLRLLCDFGRLCLKQDLLRDLAAEIMSVELRNLSFIPCSSLLDAASKEKAGGAGGGSDCESGAEAEGAKKSSLRAIPLEDGTMVSAIGPEFENSKGCDGQTDEAVKGQGSDGSGDSLYETTYKEFINCDDDVRAQLLRDLPEGEFEDQIAAAQDHSLFPMHIQYVKTDLIGENNPDDIDAWFFADPNGDQLEDLSCWYKWLCQKRVEANPQACSCRSAG